MTDLYNHGNAEDVQGSRSGSVSPLPRVADAAARLRGKKHGRKQPLSQSVSNVGFPSSATMEKPGEPPRIGLYQPQQTAGLISHLDHLVLTTANEMACIDFYTRVMGMALEAFIGGTPPVERKAFKFGGQKINLHIKGKEFEPKANAPTPGALDLCFISTLPLGEAIGRLQECHWPIIEGPVMRTGAMGRIRSVYRDPGNDWPEAGATQGRSTEGGTSRHLASASRNGLL